MDLLKKIRLRQTEGVCSKQTPYFYIKEGEKMATGNVGTVNIAVNYVVNNSSMRSVNNSIQNLQSQAPRLQNTFTSAFGKIGAACAAAFSVKALVDFSKKALELASNLQEVQNVVDVTFGQMSTTINKFAKSAIVNLGMSETTAKKYTGTFGAMAKSFGFTTEEATNLAMAITSMVGDVSSFYNLDHDLAYTKLKSIFTGETETLKDLGVVMTQTALDQWALANGYGKTTKQMTEQEKVALRYAFVMDKLKLASGDFQRTQNGWANQTRILHERFNAIIASIGDGLIILLTPAIQALNKFLSYLQVAADKFAGFVALLTGKKAEISNQAKAEAQIAAIGATAGESGENLSDLASGYEKAGSAAKKATESLASFDNVVQLSSSSSSGSDSGAGGGSLGSSIPTYEFTDNESLGNTGSLIDEMSSKLDIFKEKLRNFFDNTDLGSRIKNLFDFSILEENLGRIGKSLLSILGETTPSAKMFMESWAKSLLTSSVVVLEVVKSIAESITGGMALWLEQGSERITTWWNTTFMNLTNGFNNLTSIVNDLGSLLTTFFSFESTQQTIANVFTTIEGLISGTWMLMSGLFESITGAISLTISENFNSIGLFLLNVSTLLETLTGTISTIITDCFSIVWNVFEKYIRPAFTQFQEGFSNAFGAVVNVWNSAVMPLLQIIAESFKNLWNNHLKVFVNEVAGMVGAFVEMVATIYNKVISPIVAFVVEKFLPPIMQTISVLWGAVEGLVQNIIDIFSGLVQTLKGIFEVITGILTGDFKKISDGIMNILEGLVKAIANIFSSIVNVIIGALNGLIRAANKIKIPGTDIGVNIAEIPRWTPKLANGGIVYRETNFGNFIAGEAGAEAIVPLENSGYTQTLAREIVRSLMNEGLNGGTTYNIENAFGDDRSMERLVNKINALNKRTEAKRGVVYG